MSTLTSALPKFLNRKSKWKYEVSKTNTLPKWHELLGKVRNEKALSESRKEKIIQNLLSDILAEHASARELKKYYKTIVALSKSQRLDVFEDGWGYCLFDLPGEKNSKEYEEPWSIEIFFSTGLVWE